MKQLYLYSLLIIGSIAMHSTGVAATAKPVIPDDMKIAAPETKEMKAYAIQTKPTLLTIKDITTDANTKQFKLLKDGWWVSTALDSEWIGWSKKEAFNQEAELINILATMLGLGKQVNCTTESHAKSFKAPAWNETFLQIKRKALAQFEATFWQLPQPLDNA